MMGKLLNIGKINIIAIILITLSVIVYVFEVVSFSMFQTSIIGGVSSNIAFYLAKTDYQVKQISLDTLVPKSEPYVYNFTIGNQDDSKVSEVDINYTLKVIATTNLPLRYELYMNQDYNSASAVNLITSANTTIETDEYGTYFLSSTMDSQNLLYNSPKTNNYTLLVYFDESNNSFKYQDVVESVRLVVNSEQITE